MTTTRRIVLHTACSVERRTLSRPRLGFREVGPTAAECRRFLRSSKYDDVRPGLNAARSPSLRAEVFKSNGQNRKHLIRSRLTPCEENARWFKCQYAWSLGILPHDFGRQNDPSHRIPPNHVDINPAPCVGILICRPTRQRLRTSGHRCQSLV